MSVTAIRPPLRIEESRFEKIILTELITSLALTAICIPFVASSSLLPMIGWAVGGVVINAVARTASKVLFAKEAFGDRVIEGICCSIFYRFGARNATLLLHEAGHFFAAKALFQCSPKIVITPFEKGLTSYSTRALTSLGQMIGFRRSITIITLAGSALALLAASIALIVSIKKHSEHPYESNNLFTVSSGIFFSHASYAFSAQRLSPNQFENDFVRLASLGISPLAATVAIVAIPLFILIQMRNEPLRWILGC